MTLAKSALIILSTALGASAGAQSPTPSAEAKLRDIVFAGDPVYAGGMKCDGRANDQAALAAAISAGKRIYLPSGTCLIDQLDLNASGDANKNGKRVIGHSRKGTVLKARTNSTTKLVYVVGGKANYSQQHVLENFTVDMTNMADTATSYGIFIQDAYNNAFRDLDIVGVGKNKRSLYAARGVYTSVFQNIDFGSTTGIIELKGVSLSDAVTTLLFKSVQFGKAILTDAVNITFINPTVQGELDKFVLTSVQGVNIFGGDIEGTGTYLNMTGGKVAHVVTIGNELAGFSGTHARGTAASAILQDFSAAQPFEFINGTAGMRITDTPLTVRKTVAALHRTTFENVNATREQVDVEFRSLAAGGSTYVGQTSAGKGFMDCRAGGGCALQVGGADKLGVNAGNQIVIGTKTAKTVGAAGNAAALPATPSGYVEITIGEGTFMVPFYAN